MKEEIKGGDKLLAKDYKNVDIMLFDGKVPYPLRSTYLLKY